MDLCLIIFQSHPARDYEKAAFSIVDGEGGLLRVPSL